MYIIINHSNIVLFMLQELYRSVIHIGRSIPTKGNFTNIFNDVEYNIINAGVQALYVMRRDVARILINYDCKIDATSIRISITLYST